MKDSLYPSEIQDACDVLTLFGFPETGVFSLENSHFYLDDLRYPAFCVAMQRAHQQGLNGVTLGEVATALRDRQTGAGREINW